MWSAEAQLPRKRVELESTRKVLTGVRNVIGYCGWGSNDRARPRDLRRLGFTWLPGAIAIEYVSTNGRTFHRPIASFNFNQGQSLAADYLDEGASAVLGSVYEPYLQTIARPEYLFPAYYSGRNMIESFYLALPAISWMQVVVGDPLMKLGPP
jgi:uncharacterized protein (TIGR03790 family)